MNNPNTVPILDYEESMIIDWQFTLPALEKTMNDFSIHLPQNSIKVNKTTKNYIPYFVIGSIVLIVAGGLLYIEYKKRKNNEIRYSRQLY